MKNKYYLILVLIISLAGWFKVILFDWQLALALFFIIWGNNVAIKK